MGRHSRTEPSFLSKIHLPSREAVMKFGVKAGIVAGLGVLAVLGSKQMYDVSTMPATETAGESLSQLEDQFWGIAKGAGLFALATLGSAAFVSRLSSVRHNRADSNSLEFPLFETEEWDASLGRHAAVEPDYADELVFSELDFDAARVAAGPTRRGSHRLDDTLTDLEPIPAAA